MKIVTTRRFYPASTHLRSELMSRTVIETDVGPAREVYPSEQPEYDDAPYEEEIIYTVPAIFRRLMP